MLSELKALSNKLNGASFVSLNGYKSKTSGEVANHLINVNISHISTLKKDLDTLKNKNEQQIIDIAQKLGIDIKIVQLALSELINSMEKNISLELEKRTEASQAQNNAYISTSKCTKYNFETESTYLYGYSIRKQILLEGEYKKVNKRPKTIAKDYFRNLLKSSKYRVFKVDNLDQLKISKTELQF